MSVVTDNDWRLEFGIEDDGGKTFIASKAELSASGTEASQSHVLRRAFELLKLDGILCTQNIPLVYFKRMKRIDSSDVLRLHRKFWNHGGAPILVLVGQDEVHVYSGLTRPVADVDDDGAIPSLVETLDRASLALREFLPAVESGEFFRRHAKSFNPDQRVDRDLLDNLQATRQELVTSSAGTLDEKILDALLCRLVFACYLFDRGVIGSSYLDDIGVKDAQHLRDVLALQPRTRAKKSLYDLFRKLGGDFNGDLFSENLDAEAKLVSPSHIGPLEAFFHATDVVTGQGSFWPYDFGAIPVEAISAIYERFLKGTEKREGAFYTPRFLAELVLDMALADQSTLLGRRYLDPACGSGIFLVGLFNRIAEEWKQANPDARNDRRARELRKLLCDSLYGVDRNPTACRITAFSLYLAYLDQLSPRDIQELQEKGHRLPTLVHYPDNPVARTVEGNIWCGDFFAEGTNYPVGVDLVVGNPPWGSTASPDTPAAQWCSHPDHVCPVPDKQISAAFVWKATHHVADHGKICFVLPHGTLFNHSGTAVEFQRTLFLRHAIDQVLNLTDYQFFLFAEARHPALVISYRKQKPENVHHAIRYWSPKADWLVTRAEVIVISPEDRCTLTVGEVLDDLKGRDAPLIWKQWYWASGRDRRLIDRLTLYPRLRDYVRLTTEKASSKPWLIAEGFQPVGKGDDPAKAKTIQLPSRLFIKATSPFLDLFLLPSECSTLPGTRATTRRKIRGTDAFRAPHVLVSQGFTSIAYADFDVSFQHALRGINGPKEDRELLIFLAAYLRSPLARYFLFHTSSNWGVSRQKVHVEELLRLPFQFPDDAKQTKRSWELVKEVSSVVDRAAGCAEDTFSDRKDLVHSAEAEIETLVNEYFDILPSEKALIDDTVNVLIPSARPSRVKVDVPTLVSSNEQQRTDYIQRLSATLSDWAKGSPFVVQGRWLASEKLGVGMAVLRKSLRGVEAFDPTENLNDVLAALHGLRTASGERFNTFDLIRGAKVFDRDRLYLVKSIAQRFWTQTAALNDADEIAGTILMHTPKEVAWR
jgi:hypothetical protein